MVFPFCIYVTSLQKFRKCLLKKFGLIHLLMMFLLWLNLRYFCISVIYDVLFLPALKGLQLTYTAKNLQF